MTLSDVIDMARAAGRDLGDCAAAVVAKKPTARTRCELHFIVAAEGASARLRRDPDLTGEDIELFQLALKQGFRKAFPLEAAAPSARHSEVC
ncbi:hypothetical protein QMZ05_27665 [Bradyrhizobium sp. INPA03-11B]|uniref:hypothetical protein n=1 Tax=Bradyrhizobium sp. INPA03-11B TaxID=418598 RepID=UPI0033905634